MPSEPACFRGVAQTFVSGWRPFANGHIAKWPFYFTAGMAGGHVRIDVDGLAFEPWFESRVRGMRTATIDWAEIREIVLSDRTGVAQAVSLFVYPRAIEQNSDGICVMAFRRPALTSALVRVRTRVPTPFPALIEH